MESYSESPFLQLYHVGYSLCSFCFSVAGLIHLDLIFLQVNSQGYNFILLQVDIPLSQHHLLNTLYFLQHIFSSFLRPCHNYRWLYLWVHIFGSSVLFCCSTCLLRFLCHIVFTTLVIYFEAFNSIHSSILYLAKSCVRYMGLSCSTWNLGFF